MSVKNGNKDEPYNLFAKVILIYIIKEIKNLTGLNAAYEIDDISYLNPLNLDKQNFLYLIKNNIFTIKNYHESIRFIIKEKDYNTLKTILEKKGYKNIKECFVKIISKSSIGMSIISGKKINASFLVSDFTSAFDLGHEEKFLNFNYKITIKGFPPFYITQIVHEALFEYFKNTFVSEVRLELQHINFIKYISEPFYNFFDKFLKEENYFFYPEKIEIKDYINFELYEVDEFIKLSMNNADKTKFYFLFNMIILKAFQKFMKEDLSLINELINQIKNFILKDYFFKNIQSLEISKNDSAEKKHKIDTAGVLIYYIFGIDPFRQNKFYLYIPLEFLSSLISFISNKKTADITVKNAFFFLEALDKIIEKVRKESLLNFKYMPKKNFILDYKDYNESHLIKKEKKEKRISSIADIINFDNRIIQVALTMLKPKEITIILKTVKRDIRNKILSNMSKKTKEFYIYELSRQIKTARFEQKAYISKLISILNNISEKF